MAGYQTGVANQTTNDGTYTYTYDSAGNLIEKSEGAGLQTWYYTYDNKNDPLSVRETSDGNTNLLTLTYTYDAEGDQVEQDEWKSSGGGVATTRHVYDDRGNAWADLNSMNTVAMRYIRRGSANQLLAQIDGSASLSWYVTDNLGSVRDVVGATGTTALDHVDYGAFGRIVLESNTAATGRAQLFTGLPEDRDTGIVQAQHRALLVATGQWMQDDPIAFQAGDGNLRRFVLNDPLRYTDPSGQNVAIGAIAAEGGLALIEGVAEGALMLTPAGWVVVGVGAAGVLAFALYAHYHPIDLSLPAPNPIPLPVNPIDVLGSVTDIRSALRTGYGFLDWGRGIGLYQALVQGMELTVVISLPIIYAMADIKRIPDWIMKKMGGEKAAAEIKAGIEGNPDIYYDPETGEIYLPRADGGFESTGYNVDEFPTN